MKHSEVAEIVAMLLQAYPQAQFGPASSAMYERMLVDLDPATALEAVQRLMRTSKWLPTIAEIRTTAADVRHGPKRLGAEAWGDVTEAVRRVGAYRPPPAFTDSLVTDCVGMLGWRNLCLGANDAADRARFIELYDGLVDRRRADVVAGKALPAPSGAGVLPWRPAVRSLAAPTVAAATPKQLADLAALDVANVETERRRA